MELILIACCDRKKSGGTTNYQESELSKMIPFRIYNDLQLFRQILSEELALPGAKDIGLQKNPRVLFEPAYRRYTGRVYERSNFSDVYPSSKDKKVIIISAFYGILDACDSIREYNLIMDEKLSDGIKVKNFWKKRELGRVLQEYINFLKPTVINDLLPDSYRYALQPFISTIQIKFNAKYKLFAYPGLGTGSLWRRGEDLKLLLS